MRRQSRNFSMALADSQQVAITQEAKQGHHPTSSDSLLCSSWMHIQEQQSLSEKRTMLSH